MIVVAGHVLKEYVDLGARSFGPVLGGPAAYSAMAIRVSGANCGLVSAVAADDAALLSPLRDAGVDLAGVDQTGRTRTSELSYDESGAKSIRYLELADDITAEQVRGAYENAHGYLICPLDFEISAAAVVEIASAGVPTMVDLGGLGGVVSTRHPISDPKCRTDVERIVAAVDVVKASDEDCRWITGFEDPFRNADHLVAYGAAVALITRGADGVVIKVGSAPAVAIPGFRVTAADTTGAGDAFCGGFLAEFVAGGDEYRSAAFGSALASFVVESSGGVTARRYPRRADIQIRATSLLAGADDV